jgi:hypothetical protein
MEESTSGIGRKWLNGISSYSHRFREQKDSFDDVEPGSAACFSKNPFSWSHDDNDKQCKYSELFSSLGLIQTVPEQFPKSKLKCMSRDEKPDPDHILSLQRMAYSSVRKLLPPVQASGFRELWAYAVNLRGSIRVKQDATLLAVNSPTRAAWLGTSPRKPLANQRRFRTLPAYPDRTISR